jgi:hypothetical protein
MKRTVNAAFVFLGLAFGIAWVQAAQQRLADSLPTQYTDAEFWRLVTDFSEPDGEFRTKISFPTRSTIKWSCPK